MLTQSVNITPSDGWCYIALISFLLSDNMEGTWRAHNVYIERVINDKMALPVYFSSAVTVCSVG